MSRSFQQALQVIAQQELRTTFTDLEVVLISSILSKAADIERETARRSTHVAVHPDTLPQVGTIYDLVVVRCAELRPGLAYLMVGSTP